ncbi:MAG: hypothetical protein M3Z24_12930 [Chloroflexota bacterium]|nr:hypothetical protein [Chloroflexota bacterium]
MAAKTPTRTKDNLQTIQRAARPASNRFLNLPRDARLIDRYIREGRFQRSLSLITAFSSLLSGLEVAYEHYIGSYGQRIMYTPVIISPLLFIAGIWGAFSKRAARTVLPIISVITVIDGIVGFIFHIRGVARKPGGWRIPVFNIVMGPPLFAPLLFAVSGFLGIIASFLRREDAPIGQTSDKKQSRPMHLDFLPSTITQEIMEAEQDIREGRFQQGLAVATAISALFSGFESLYSHYKNNFSYRIEWTPILLTPAIMIAGIGSIWSRKMAETLLPLTSALAVISGALGFFYHARGIVRRPGGIKMPLYNLLYGPPIFAPMLFAATGFLGLLASLLRRSK